MAKFFRILLPGYEDRMTIPGNFAQLLKNETGTAARAVSISSPLGKLWRVKLSHDKRNTYFTKGWTEFLEAHDMQIGELMVFSYDGQSTFSVEIFDKTTSIKKYNCRDGRRDSQVPDSQLPNVVFPDGSDDIDSYTGGNGSSEYTKERSDSESLYCSSEGLDSCGIESTAIIPLNLEKRSKDSDKDVRPCSGTVVNGRVNRGGRKSNDNSKKIMNLDALSATGFTFKTINESYNFSYMPLNKAFCDSSQYKLTQGKAIVRNEKMEEYDVKYRVCGKYNFIGKGWKNFCEASNVRRGDRCQIKIIGDNEFLVIFKHVSV